MNKMSIYETEKAYPRQSHTDKNNEYSYLYTECGNWWYIGTTLLGRNNWICPNCGRIVKVVM